MRWYVSSPVDPIPGSGSGGVFQQALNRPQRQVTLAVGSPVAGLPPFPAGVFTATQRVLAVCRAAGFILLSGEMVTFKSSQLTKNILPFSQPSFQIALED